MSVISKLTKRRFYPFQIDGETIHLRSMLSSELDTVQKFRDDDESLGFMIGCCVLNENGSAEFIKTETETARDERGVGLKRAGRGWPISLVYVRFI